MLNNALIIICKNVFEDGRGADPHSGEDSREFFQIFNTKRKNTICVINSFC